MSREREHREQQRTAVLYGTERRSRGERAKLTVSEEQFKKKERKNAHLAGREKMGKRCLTVLASLHRIKSLYGSVSSIQSFRGPPLIADDFTSHCSSA